MPPALPPDSRRAVFVALIAFAGLSCAPEDRSAPAVEVDAETAQYRWVVLGPDGQALARAVVVGSRSCPDIHLDDATRAMTPRSADPPPGFEAVWVCESPIPAGTVSASIGGQALALPVSGPDRIVVLGDTGCRVKGSDVQNCSGPDSLGPVWNFAQVAAAARDAQPELILHVGDYHYREHGACGPRCDPATVGYTWASWEADFFEPAEDLLPVAPWVFIRGNHEDCGTDAASARAWRGWFYFLDPRALPADPWQQANCQSFTDPYRVPTGAEDILIMDTSEIPDDYVTPDPVIVARYAHEFGVMEDLVQGETPTWLATHRPFWGVASFLSAGPNEEPQIATTDATLQAALQASPAGRIPSAVDALIAGHVHLFEMLTFTDGRPPQVVFGGGGTALDPAITDALLAATPSVLQDLGVAPEDFSTIDGIDFGVIEPITQGWRITLRSATGSTDKTFTITRD